jgi:hypothetical protein
MVSMADVSSFIRSRECFSTVFIGGAFLPVAPAARRKAIPCRPLYFN